MNRMVPIAKLYLILLSFQFLSYFFSYASHGQYCAHGPKTTIKLMVRVHAITPNPWVKIMFERPERATANKYTK